LCWKALVLIQDCVNTIPPQAVSKGQNLGFVLGRVVAIADECPVVSEALLRQTKSPMPVKPRSKQARKQVISESDALRVFGSFFDDRQAFVEAPVRDVRDAKLLKYVSRLHALWKPILVNKTEPLREDGAPLLA
jgi:hypothetical protein